MNRKKILSLFLIVTLISSFFAGCKKEEASSTNSTEKIKISMTLMGGPKKPDTWFQKELGNKLNAEFDFIMLPGWEEKNVKTNLLMQDKDKMPDVLWFNGMGKEYTQWVEAGLLVDLIPLLKNTADKNILKKMTAEMLFPYYKDGKLYRIPTDIGGNGCCMSTFVRKDWLDKLGLEVPKTVDDFIKVARAFTKNDPDGNGKNDTYGFGGQNSGSVDWRAFSPIFYAYGYAPDFFGKYKDGTVKLGATVPETKQALIVLRDMYKEGLIEPTIFTGNDIGQLVSKNKIGMFYSWQSFYNPEDGTNKALKANVPNAELLPIDPIKGPEGFSADYPEPPGSWCYISVTSHAKDPQAVVNVLDKMMTKEIGMLNEYGEEGKHYKIENGKVVRTISEEEKNNLGLGSLGWIWFGPKLVEDPPQIAKLAEDRAKSANAARDRIHHFSLSVRDNMPTYMKHATEIDDMMNEVFVGIITGQKDISEYDKFVNAFYNKFEGHQIEKEATDLYNREQVEFEKFKEFYDKELKVQ
ncbi:ABC-type glycerol-3-phosphate transport system, substrate-binding protein [Caloramator quimbayensis]|uniref:ABC-type glycerol-3-phosphate transport system, substrate-binding protein n=1 Tax=Caloramator quimbayensis TaxID=1147123 RepID=A0A1T4WHK4_9CLOT|nr:extracellular solute-binding protein [Caloramator quimbayensis]SKA76131.1 ABC-type glycerol-3-phosphate transport system, substrate-binding protein [Caloramator quimbayensis]